MNERYESQILRSPIEPNRALLSNGIESANGFEEYYDEQIGARILSVPAGTNEHARHHEELSEMRFPVFSGIYNEDRLLLLVPDDCRPFRKLLRFIDRDLETYGEVFTELGGMLRELHTSGFGVPEATSTRSMLDGLAYAVDEASPYGGRIYLVPPYQLDPEISLKQACNQLRTELDQAKVFSPNALRYLMGLTAQGAFDA